ncbi:MULTISPECIES: LysR family transcriptional regulator [Paraburkholderia]|uniref:LysR family transcriptional regulator n=1 Tax=Paraburkholderia madseniana TaxID=2599607 RepID=A0AAP5BH37_9BURK|nr:MULTISPECIES: LysR family transcriptional regulator [Paraburkholderia]MCX4148818.1 LysR family transcriptional regulator [Paraburkholderia madseniana]MCX4175451.1 LysR family transcriptional regulator [Paraburkholderia madseniana]MDN7151756.1 LysR family transcriptional regulator [Paraburkholderia sp. WS6]MDQ6410636.1 LysR family transcriptional regulator [Paraburkholderia madseniana]MDQ6463448.1 LysR family transcriptional regulator [Paraburkholderia madseniana]
MDRLRAYEVFVTVVSRGSFTRAADALETSPANVTRYVNELEAHLGTRLLNRTSRRLSLTEGGETLYARCKSILDDVAETEGLVSSASVEPRGRLRINAPVSFGILHLAPLWPEFMRKYPGVELDVALIDRVVDIVEEGYDLAIRISRAGSTSHAARKLATSRNILCASPDYLARCGYPAAPADLIEHQCIGYSYAATGDEWQLMDSEHKAHTVKVNCHMHTNNGDTARAAALAGQGVIWQPTFLIGNDLRAGKLVQVLPDYRLPDIDVLALYPSRRHLSAKIRAVVDFLVDAFGGVPPWDRDSGG